MSNLSKEHRAEIQTILGLCVTADFLIDELAKVGLEIRPVGGELATLRAWAESEREAVRATFTDETPGDSHKVGKSDGLRMVIERLDELLAASAPPSQGPEDSWTNAVVSIRVPLDEGMVDHDVTATIGEAVFALYPNASVAGHPEHVSAPSSGVPAGEPPAPLNLDDCEHGRPRIMCSACPPSSSGDGGEGERVTMWRFWFDDVAHSAWSLDDPPDTEDEIEVAEFVRLSSSPGGEEETREEVSERASLFKSHAATAPRDRPLDHERVDPQTRLLSIFTAAGGDGAALAREWFALDMGRPEFSDWLAERIGLAVASSSPSPGERLARDLEESLKPLADLAAPSSSGGGEERARLPHKRHEWWEKWVCYRAFVRWSDGEHEFSDEHEVQGYSRSSLTNFDVSLTLEDDEGNQFEVWVEDITEIRALSPKLPPSASSVQGDGKEASNDPR